VSVSLNLPTALNRVADGIAHGFAGQLSRPVCMQVASGRFRLSSTLNHLHEPCRLAMDAKYSVQKRDPNSLPQIATGIWAKLRSKCVKIAKLCGC
jgi:hypothetical protein